MTMEELSNVHGRAWEDVDVSTVATILPNKRPRIMVIVITMLMSYAALRIESNGFVLFSDGRVRCSTCSIFVISLGQRTVVRVQRYRLFIYQESINISRHCSSLVAFAGWSQNKSSISLPSVRGRQGCIAAEVHAVKHRQPSEEEEDRLLAHDMI